MVVLRINEIKLNNNYKSLKKNQIFRFNHSSVQAIVGINGSGKSSLMELISKIFIEVHNVITRESYKNEIEFEMTYSMQNDYMTVGIISEVAEELVDCEIITIRVSLEKGKLKIFIKGNEGYIEVENQEYYIALLPRKIIAYSSGHNETISQGIVDFRMRSILDDGRYIVKSEADKSYLISRNALERYNNLFYYLDDERSKLAILVAFLLDSDLSDKIGSFIDALSLRSFKLRFDELDVYKQKIKLGDEINYVIDSIYTLNNTDKFDSIGNYFYSYFNEIDDEERNLIKSKLPKKRVMFEGLQKLFDYNILKIKKNKRNEIVNGSVNDIQLEIDRNIGNDRVFDLFDMKFLNSERHLINLSDLSDGEYQLLQFISMISIYEDSNTLFLLDEIETHFNPSWKTQVISTINEHISPNSQVIFSTHNPDVLTDIKSASIIFMRNGVQNPVPIETFAANPNIISANLFSKTNTVSAMAKSAIVSYMRKIESVDKTELSDLRSEILRELGDSSERLLLLIEIDKRLNE